MLENLTTKVLWVDMQWL